jgi:hypothetical protein
VRIDVHPDGNPWIVNSSNRIYRWNGSQWIQLPGEATEIGIGKDGSVFILGKSSISGGHKVLKWTGSTWLQYPGAAVAIDVDTAGRPWIVNSAGNISRWDGQWISVPGAAVDVGIGGNGSVYILGEGDSDGHNIFRWLGPEAVMVTWLQLPGKADRISADNAGRAWITTRSRNIYHSN